MKKKKLAALIIVSAAAVAVLAVLTFGDRGFLDVYRLYNMETARAKEVAEAQSKIDSLKAEIERLKNDTAYIERIAREKLGMAKKDELIFKFVEE
jgi:cell division protein FtsB